MARISNKQMVEELQRGDRQGCVHLVDVYQGLLLHEAVRVFRIRREDAEEIVSDTLLVVVRKISGFRFKRGDGDFHLWVMTIFRNRVRDFVRHQALHGKLIEGFSENVDEDDVLMRSVVRQYQSEVQREMQEEPETMVGVGKLQMIADVLDTMESWERVLLRCRALDVPYEDIATYTGKPVKQLKVYHARVRAKFVTLLAKHFPELQKNSAGVEVDET